MMDSGRPHRHHDMILVRGISMMGHDVSRRAWLGGVAGGVAAAAATGGDTVDKPGESFGFCLNTSTVRDADGKSRPVTQLVEIAAKAGYQAIEPWIGELEA